MKMNREAREELYDLKPRLFKSLETARAYAKKTGMKVHNTGDFYGFTSKIAMKKPFLVKKQKAYDPAKKDLTEYFISMAYQLGQTQGESSSFHETPIYRAVVYAQNYDDAVNKISSMHDISNEKAKRILDDMIKFYLRNNKIVSSKTKILPDAYYDRKSATDFEHKYKLGMGYVKLYDPKKQHKGSWLDFVKAHKNMRTAKGLLDLKAISKLWKMKKGVRTYDPKRTFEFEMMSGKKHRIKASSRTEAIRAHVERHKGMIRDIRELS